MYSRSICYSYMQLWSHIIISGRLAPIYLCLFVWVFCLVMVCTEFGLLADVHLQLNCENDPRLCWWKVPLSCRFCFYKSQALFWPDALSVTTNDFGWVQRQGQWATSPVLFFQTLSRDVLLYMLWTSGTCWTTL